jgi:methylenetetrahydrofolate dehydrogenase (NADP+) / methenyltetrahydrofolate cyclohydrolase
VRNKVKACRTAWASVLDRLPADLSEAALLARIARAQRRPHVHGILVQLPLPRHIDAHKVIEAISPAKDVDGFSRRQRRCADGRPARLRPARPTAA